MSTGTNSWDLAEFDQHATNLESVITEARTAKSNAGAAGAGDLYIYGLLVGPIATPIMDGVVGSAEDLLESLVELNESALDTIVGTRNLNHTAEQNNVDHTAEIVDLIAQTV